MRNGTYRGKRKDNGEWAIGARFSCVEGDGDFICDAIMLDKKSNKARMFCADEVDPDTICEYSGLDDADGKHIFEWDILYNPYRRKSFLVWYDEESFQWKIRSKRKSVKIDTCEDDSLSIIASEPASFGKMLSYVSGNIYDNPEMNREYWFPKEDGAF